MHKSIYEFTKIFAFLFVLGSIGFLITGLYMLAIMAIATALIIFFISSDWFFVTFDLQNNNGFVIFLTFVLIFVNAYFIYQEFCNSTLFAQISDDDKSAYALYENTLINSASPCIDEHNSLVEKMKAGTTISNDEIKNVHKYCYIALDNINDATLGKVSNNLIKDMSVDIKGNFKKILVNLITYNYSSKEPQTMLTDRINKSYAELKTNLQKSRKLTKIAKNKNNDTKDIVIKF